mgnify:CR=1 FL=1
MNREANLIRHALRHDWPAALGLTTLLLAALFA